MQSLTNTPHWPSWYLGALYPETLVDCTSVESMPYTPEKFLEEALSKAKEGKYAELDYLLIQGDDFEETERIANAGVLLDQGYTFGPILARMAFDKSYRILRESKNLKTELPELKKLHEEVLLLFKQAQEDYERTSNVMPQIYLERIKYLKERLGTLTIYAGYKAANRSRKKKFSKPQLFELAGRVFNSLNLVSQASELYKEAFRRPGTAPPLFSLVNACHCLNLNNEAALACQIFEKSLGDRATPECLWKVKAPCLINLSRWEEAFKIFMGSYKDPEAISCKDYETVALCMLNLADKFNSSEQMEQRFLIIDNAMGFYRDALKKLKEIDGDYPSPDLTLRAVCAVLNSRGFRRLVENSEKESLDPDLDDKFKKLEV